MPLTLSPSAPRDSATVVDDAALAAETRLDRVLKLIPTEVITVYPAALALAAVFAWPYYEATMAVLGLIAVVLVLGRDGAKVRMKPTRHQHVVRCLAFAAWTMVLGNPLAVFSISAEQAHLFGAVGAAFIPVLGYLASPEAQ